MIQTAKVIRILEDGRAEVSVQRQSACGHDCSKCGGGCAELAVLPTVVVKAENPVRAMAGDTVTVESSSHQVLSFIWFRSSSFLSDTFLVAPADWGMELLLYSVSLAFCWGSCVRLLWTGITGRAGGLRSALLPFREPGCRCSAMCVPAATN